MNLSDKIRKLVSKGAESSRELLSKAGAKAQVWGEMGVLRVEIIQLRNQAEKLVEKLGAEAYAALGERGEASLPATSVADLIREITDLGERIESKEAEFRRLGGKDSDLDGEDRDRA